MGAAVDDPAVLEVDHLVGQPDRGLAVGDHDQRRCGAVALGRARSASRMRASTSGSTARGGVVEDQQPRPADQRAGQRDPLPLAAGERGAALPEPGVEAVGQRGDEAVGLGRAQRRPDLLVGDVGAEGDVAAHGVVEEERGLRHERDRAGELALRAGRAGRCRRAGSGPPSGSTSRVISVVSVLLPDAVAPTSGDGAARLDVEGDVVEQRLRRAS